MSFTIDSMSGRRGLRAVIADLSDQEQREIGRCVAAAEHALKNPVFGITANLDALRAEPDAQAVLPEYLDRLYGETAKISALVRDLTGFLSPLAAQPRRVALNVIVERAVGPLRARASAEGVALMIDVPRNIEVHADEQQLEEAIRNVIENALIFSPRGKTVRVLGSEAELIVEDERAEFRVEEGLRAFDPFVARPKGGTGLAMAIAKRNLDENRARIDVDKTSEGGARITIAIPSAVYAS